MSKLAIFSVLIGCAFISVSTSQAMTCSVFARSSFLGSLADSRQVKEREIQVEIAQMEQRTTELFARYNTHPFAIEAQPLERLKASVLSRDLSPEAKRTAVDEILRTIPGFNVEGEMRELMSENLLNPTVFSTFLVDSPNRFVEAQFVLFQFTSAQTLPYFTRTTTIDIATFRLISPAAQKIRGLRSDVRGNLEVERLLSSEHMSFLSRAESREDAVRLIREKKAEMSANVSSELETTMIQFLESTARDNGGGGGGAFRTSAETQVLEARLLVLEPRILRGNEFVSLVRTSVDRVAVARFLLKFQFADVDAGTRHIDALERAEQLLTSSSSAR